MTSISVEMKQRTARENVDEESKISPKVRLNSCVVTGKQAISLLSPAN
jgi:hypothetical protein